MGSGKLKKFNKNAAEYYNGKKYKKKTPSGQLYCSKCNKTVQAVMVTGADIYPSRPDLAKKKFWQCPTCKNYCSYGALQVAIPTPELRDARRKIHKIIDPLWKSGMVSRGWVYKEMSEIAGYPFHNGTLTNPGEADKMYRAALKVRDRALVEYTNRRKGYDRR